MLRTISAFSRLGDENAFAVLARAQHLQAQGRDIINLGIGQPDFATPAHIVEAAVKALRDGHHGYTDARGIRALREAVCAWTLRFTDVEINPDNVMIMPGGKPAMYAAITLFGAPGADILYPDPGFPIYHSMIAFSGARPVPVPITQANGFAFRARDVLDLITPHTRLIILNSPANPTGGVTPRAEIDALAAGLARRPDIAILSDEIYGRMCYDGNVHTSLLRYPHLRRQLIHLDGCSKTFAMTGWRLGFSIWPDALLEPVRKLAVNAWSCVNTAAQYAAIAALTGPLDAVETMMAAFAERRTVIVDGLNAINGVSCLLPGGAFYAFADVTAHTRKGRASRALASELLEKAGVAVIAGTDFGANGEGYLRFSYANSRQNIERALKRVSDYLDGKPMN